MAEPFTGTEIVVLPQSKKKVRVRRPSLITLLASGGFPADLAAIVWGMYEKGEDPEKFAREPDGIRNMALLMETYVPYVLVSPTIGPTTHVAPDSEGVLTGTINLLDLHDIDKRFLFFYGQGLLDTPAKEEVSAQALDTFPEGAASPDTRPAREPVRSEAVDDGGVASEPASA
jgi:hypothetical protein